MYQNYTTCGTAPQFHKYEQTCLPMESIQNAHPFFQFEK
jgi:hypothetical protein